MPRADRLAFPGFPHHVTQRGLKGGHVLFSEKVRVPSSRRKVAAAAEAWGADRAVAEKNNGGEMVAAVLRAVDVGLPATLVHAADGKAARAEPVAVLFESGKATLAGRFPELEAQLAGLTYGRGCQGPGRGRAETCRSAPSSFSEVRTGSGPNG